MKEKLEKLFDEKFPKPEGGNACNTCEVENDLCESCNKEREEIKQFIFETVILEVLESIKVGKKIEGDIFVKLINRYIDDKSKELYNIDL